VYVATQSGGDGNPPAANEPTPTVSRTVEPPVATATPTSEPTQAGPLPDLVITYVEADDVGSETVPEYMIDYRIENVGNAEAGPSVVHLMIAGKRHCEDEVGAMGPGKGYDGAFTCTLSESELSLLRVCADGFEQVAERDEDNNCAEYEYQ
jgi:subtilase family serine protease